MEINNIIYAIQGAVFKVRGHLGSVFLEEAFESSDKADDIGFARRARG